MKEGLHPEYHPVVFVDGAADFELVTRSTKTSTETREIDGVDHYVLRVEISSASHPFFTGEQRFIDTAGRVEKFQRKYKQFYQAQDDARETVVKKADEVATAAPAASDEAMLEGAPAAPEADAVAEADDAALETGADAEAEPSKAETISEDSAVDAGDTEVADDPEAES